MNLADDQANDVIDGVDAAVKLHNRAAGLSRGRRTAVPVGSYAPQAAHGRPDPDVRGRRQAILKGFQF